MKKFELINQTYLNLKDLDLNSLDPSFRRATPNMILATLGCQKLLESIPNVARDEISFLLGSHFGEIGMSLDFLKTYHDTQIPRPILFQNSLHNSTLGFATIHLKLTGPAMTVSTGQQTVTSTFDLVENMLLQTPFALICFVDGAPENVFQYYREFWPEFERYQNQAYCFLLSTSEARSQLQLDTCACPWNFFPCSI